MQRRIRRWAGAASVALLLVAWRGTPPAVVRGPFLQDLEPNGVTVVVRTADVADATLRLWRRGTREERRWTSTSALEHVFCVDALVPETEYEYAIDVDGTEIPFDGELRFRTAPPPASRRPFRFVAFGDSGTLDGNQMDVAARLDELPRPPDLILGLGDLVYPNGEPQGYDPRLFTPYRKAMARAPFWPTLGNHDARTQNGAPFFEAFHLPTDTGAPGHPSGTEHYYAFDHGMAHFVCLDSESGGTGPGSPMVTWLQDDLADAKARGLRWTIVFLHHPPYSHGTHDSDTDARLQRIHDDLVPVFEAWGVDLVLAGHSHVYERSFLARSDAPLQSDPSAYSKIGSPDGTIYMVSGCGGRTGSGSLDHPLMAFSRGNVAGFNAFDVSWDQCHGYFVDSSGVASDLFVLRKQADSRPPRLLSVQPRGPNGLTLVFDEPLQPGTGPGGAENTALYSLVPSVPVLSARLASDRRTVELDLASPPTGLALELTVAGVADPAGHALQATRHLAFPSATGGPLARIAGDRPVVVPPATVHFEFGASLDPAGGSLSFFFDPGDGVLAPSGPSAAFTYTLPGTYTAALVTRDAAGAESVAQFDVRALDTGSAPDIRLAPITAPVPAGIPTTFDASGSFDPDGGPLWFAWDFGDPTSGSSDYASGSTPTHTFAAQGTTTVRLVVTDDEGASTALEIPVTVGAPEPPRAGGGCALAPHSAPPADPGLSLPYGLLLAALAWGARRRRPTPRWK